MMPYSWLDRRDLSMDFGTICGFKPANVVSQGHVDSDAKEYSFFV
jgi:hypothetical protein